MGHSIVFSYGANLHFIQYMVLLAHANLPPQVVSRSVCSFVQVSRSIPHTLQWGKRCRSKLRLPLMKSGANIIMVPWALPRVHTNLFSRYYRTQASDQQTDTPTGHV